MDRYIRIVQGYQFPSCGYQRLYQVKDPHSSPSRGDVSFSSAMSMPGNHGSKTTQERIHAVLMLLGDGVDTTGTPLHARALSPLAQL